MAALGVGLRAHLSRETLLQVPKRAKQVSRGQGSEEATRTEGKTRKSDKGLVP